MIIWGIFWGAVLGSWFGGYGDFGPFVGGILGFFAGLSLRWAIRSAIRTELQAHATKATAQPTRAPQAAAVAKDRSEAAAPVPTEFFAATVNVYVLLLARVSMSQLVWRPQSTLPPPHDTVKPSGLPPRHPECDQVTRAVFEPTASAVTFVGGMGTSLTTTRMVPVRLRPASLVASATV